MDCEIEGRRLEAEAVLKRCKADIAALQLSELEGTKRRSAEVVADNVYFGDSKRDAAGDNGGYSPAPSYGYSAPAAPAAGSSHGYAAPAAPAPASDFSMIEDDDSQLPF